MQPHSFHHIYRYPACSRLRIKHVVTSHMHEWAEGVETLFLMLNNYYNKSLRFCAVIVARRLFRHCRLNIVWLMDVRESPVSGASGDIFLLQEDVDRCFIRAVHRHPSVHCSTCVRQSTTSYSIAPHVTGSLSEKHK